VRNAISRSLHIPVCAVAGAALSLAFPKANLYPIAWFAVAPLMYYTYRLPWKQALLSGFVFGLAFFLSLLYWVGMFGLLPLVLLAVIQSLYIMAFVGLARVLGSGLGVWGRMILLPALWIIAEWMSSLWITGFPWGNTGYSQYKLLPLVQVSSATGVLGVSFLLALSNAVVANWLTARRSRSAIAQAGVVVALVVALWIWGSAAIVDYHVSGRPVRVAVVQGNIRQNVPHDAAYIARISYTYGRLTQEAADRGAKLVVWPEGVAPGCVNCDPVLLRHLTEVSEKSDGVRILVGGRGEAGDGRTFNCAYLIGSPEGLLGTYSKVQRVPFGEFVPLRDYLPLLARYRVMPYDVSPGPGFNVLRSGRDKIGAVICFESAFYHIGRSLANSGAEILCVITNDTWFGRTAAPEQHMSKSVFRAVENRRFVLRGAVTGISCVIDPCGRMVSRAGLFEEKLLVSDVAFISEKSFYTRHGDWLVCLSMLASLLLGATSLRARRRHPSSQR